MQSEEKASDKGREGGDVCVWLEQLGWECAIQEEVWLVDANLRLVTTLWPALLCMFSDSSVHCPSEKRFRGELSGW